MHWFDENDSVCCSRDIQMENYCPPCQMKVLVEFSKNLHDFNIIWFFLSLAQNNNEILYLSLSFWLLQLFNSLSERFFVKAGRYQKDNVGQTFTFSNQDFYV